MRRVSFFMAAVFVLSMAPSDWKGAPLNLPDRPHHNINTAIASQNNVGAVKEGRTRGKNTMEIHLKSEEIDEIRVKVGDTIFLESLRQAVVPPYLMIMPFYTLPEFIRYVESRPLDEDGVHGTIFVFHVKATGQGQLTVGFKDMQSGKITHKKVLQCFSGRINGR